jgi:glycosyltransferase involved in cell wall biosynthesis
MAKVNEPNDVQFEAPTVSVIMNCYNGEKYLKEAVGSVYSQTYQNWEIIFWDNASTDNSAEIAKSYDDKLRYFRGEKTVPLYAARNYALKKARGKYIAILDCDDLWLPTRLEEQIPLLERDDTIGLVHSDAFMFNEKGKEKRHFEIVTPYRGNIFKELLLCNFICTQTVVIRKDAFDSLDMWFDGRLTLSGDYDAYLRISYRWKVAFVDKPLARYRIHRESGTYKEGRKLETVELDLVIENLSKAVNGFEKNYPEGIRSLRKMRDLQLSLLDWENGDKKKARERLNVYIQDGVYYLALSLLMYFPYRYVFHPCRRVYTLYTKDVIA